MILIVHKRKGLTHMKVICLCKNPGMYAVIDLALGSSLLHCQREIKQGNYFCPTFPTYILKYCQKEVPNHSPKQKI